MKIFATASKQDIDIHGYYTRYGPMVLRQCRRLLQDEEQAYDTMQEVFLRLILSKKRLKPTYPSSLLYRIATNLCINKIRDQRKFQNSEYPDILQHHSPVENPENRAITSSLLRFIFEGEKESTHQMAVMYYVEGLTLKEIAASLGYSSSGVHKRLKKLSARFSKTGEVI